MRQLVGVDMEPVTTILGIIVAIIGVGAGVIQIIDYIEKKRQRKVEPVNQYRKPRQVKSTSIVTSSTLASANIRHLMQDANYEALAIDDCVLIAGSENFQGWSERDMIVTVEEEVPLSPELQQLMVLDFRACMR
jgi:predicted membrane protein